MMRLEIDVPALGPVYQLALEQTARHLNGLSEDYRFQKDPGIYVNSAAYAIENHKRILSHIKALNLALR